MDKPINTYSNNDGEILAIYPDEDYEFFRDLDVLGHMYCWHKRYDLGMPHDFEQPYDLFASFGCDGVHDAIAKGHVVVPIYLYDHSGLALSSSPFSCPWDSGQIGYYVITKEQMIKEYGDDPEAEDRAFKYALGMIEGYGHAVAGEVYSACIYNNEEDYHDDIVADSCCGYLGSDSLSMLEIVDQEDNGWQECTL